MFKNYVNSRLRIVMFAAVGVGVGIPVTVKLLDWQERRFDVVQAVVQDAQSAQFKRAASVTFSIENPPSPENFDPRQFRPRQPAITDFKVVSAKDATEHVEDDELVLGVVVDDQSRAYPINMMNGPHREVFNDVLAERPIAATW